MVWKDLLEHVLVLFGADRPSQSQILAEHVTPEGVTIRACRGNMCLEESDAIVNAANIFLKNNGGVAAAIRKAAKPDFQDECDAWVASNGPLKTGDTAASVGAGGDLKCRRVIHVVGPVWRGLKDAEIEVRGTITSIDGENAKMSIESGADGIAEAALKIYRAAAGFTLTVGAEVIALGKIKEAAFVLRYVTGVDHTVAKSDEQLLAGAVAAALNKAEEEKLASICVPAISSGIFGFPLEDCARIHVEQALGFAKSCSSVKTVVLIDFDEKAAVAFAGALCKATGAKMLQ